MQRQLQLWISKMAAIVEPLILDSMLLLLARPVEKKGLLLGQWRRKIIWQLILATITIIIERE